MKLRNALLAATILALPVAVHAQPVDGLYIGAGAGGNILQNETVKRISNGPANLGHGSDYKFNAGPVVVGSVGYGLGNGLRFELQGAFYENKINRLANGGAGGGRQTSAGGDEYKEGVFANALYDIPLNSFGFNSPIFPYVGAGVGYVHNQFNNGHIAEATNGVVTQYLRSTGQNDNLGVQGIVGFSFPVYDYVPGLAFTAEYRFLSEIGGRSYKDQYFAPRVAIGTKQKFSTDDFNHSFLLGVRYAFNAPTPAAGRCSGSGAGTAAGPHLPGVLRLGSCGPDRPRPADRLRGRPGHDPRAVTRIEVQGYTDRSGTRGLQPAPVAASCADRRRRAGARRRAARRDRHPGLR